MPSLSDIPGADRISGGGRRVHKVAAGAAVAAIAIGGFALGRILRRGGGGDDGEEGAVSADPIAQTPTAPPDAEKRAAPPKPPPDAEKPPLPPKPPRPDPPRPAPPTPEPPAPEPRATEPGDRSKDAEPHHALNNPVTDDPDPTEWPDPYEQREDPRDPVDPDGAPFGEEPHPATGSESTSEPHPSEDPEAGERAKPPERDR